MKRWLILALVVVLVMAMAVPAFAASKYKKPALVSHPYTKRDRLKVGKDFNVWGYISPRLASSTPTTLTIVGQQYIKPTKTAKGSWESTASLNATGTLSATGKFKRKTNYTAVLNCGATGRYRIRAVLMWTDTKGVQHTKKSSWKYFRVVK